jgi:hypothetical protein
LIIKRFEYFNPELVSGLLGNIDTTLGIDFFNFLIHLKGGIHIIDLVQAVNDLTRFLKKIHSYN